MIQIDTASAHNNTKICDLGEKLLKGEGVVKSERVVGTIGEMLDLESFLKLLSVAGHDRGKFIKAFSNNQNIMVPWNKTDFPKKDQSLFLQRTSTNEYIIPNNDAVSCMLRPVVGQKITEIGSDRAKPARITVIQPAELNNRTLFTNALTGVIQSVAADNAEVIFKCDNRANREFVVGDVPNNVKSVTVKGTTKKDGTLNDGTLTVNSDMNTPLIVQNAPKIIVDCPDQRICTQVNGLDAHVHGEGRKMHVHGDTISVAETKLNLVTPNKAQHTKHGYVGKSQPNANKILDLKGNRVHISHPGIESAAIQSKDSNVPSAFSMSHAPHQLKVSGFAEDGQCIGLYANNLEVAYPGFFDAAKALQAQDCYFDITCKSLATGTTDHVKRTPPENTAEERKE